jgi:hypothetical protein
MGTLVGGWHPARDRGQTGSYQLAGVRGAGTLLGDTHAETGQAAFRVAGTQVEVVRSAVTASTALHLGLGETDTKMCAGTRGQSSQPLLTSSREQPYLPHPMTRSQDPLGYHRTSLQPRWWTELDYTEGRALN